MKLRLALLLVGLPLGLYAFGLITPNANAQTVTILHSFGVSPDDGKGPMAGLVQGSDGNFYGTTWGGGTSLSNGYSYGTVFRISPSGSYTTLYQFAGYPNDGQNPTAGLVQGTDGNFYGTTYYGGGVYGDFFGNYGNGTVFRISPSGSYTSLYSFAGYPNDDGAYPYAGLVQGSDGNFYGTTYEGGGYGYYYGLYGSGSIFSISPSGSEANLYDIGGYPKGGLVQGTDGNFYGATGTGGHEYGNVFRISPSASETNLYNFRGFPNDGQKPYAGLMQGSDGNFYGTTQLGGPNQFCGPSPGGCGTVFRISPSGTFTTLYAFGSSPNDGQQPMAGLVQGSDGNFYGTTVEGGNTDLNYGLGFGTIFRISPSGTYTTLYSFVGGPSDGASPYASLVQGSDGNFYGTTIGGGAGYTGTVFKLTVPLNPPPYPINQISGIQFFTVLDSTIVALPIPSVAGETYQLQYSDSMSPVNWINTGDPALSIGGPLVLIDLAEPLPPQRFYRAVITP